MTRVNIWDLKLKGGPDPLPSVEVDTADNYEVFLACEREIGRVLAALGHLKKPPVVTIYVFEGPSINFGDMTQSVFFAVAGTERVLTLVRAAVGNVPGTRVRYSDYIPAARCVPRLHFQDGLLWVPTGDDEWEAQGS